MNKLKDFLAGCILTSFVSLIAILLLFATYLYPEFGLIVLLALAVGAYTWMVFWAFDRLSMVEKTNELY